MSDMTYSMIGVVTGANKGIGLAIVRQLALQYPRTSPDGRLLVYLTARDPARGQAALSSLQSDPALKEAKALGDDGGRADVRFHELDIVNSGSIDQLAKHLKEKHPGGLDFVVNNAGIAMTGFNEHVVRTTLNCNYHGTLATTRALLPLLKPRGRIVNVASSVGYLGRFSPELATRFRSATSVSSVDRLMDDFVDAVCRGREGEEGWPSAAYAVSKAGVIGMTRALASEARAEGSEREFSSCHPGYVDTDMTKGKGPKTPDEGASTPVGLALGVLKGKSGGLWDENGNEIEW